METRRARSTQHRHDTRDDSKCKVKRHGAIRRFQLGLFASPYCIRLCGWHHRFHGWTAEGAGRCCREGLEVWKESVRSWDKVCDWSPLKLCGEEKTSEVWTARRRRATRKLVVSGGCVWERHKDTEWVDEKCRGRGLTICWREVETKRTQTSNADWNWQRGIAFAPSEWRGRTTWRPAGGNFETKLGMSASGTKWPPTARCREFRAGGVRATVQWCMSITMRRRRRCTWSTEYWMQSLSGAAYHPKSKADGFLALCSMHLFLTILFTVSYTCAQSIDFSLVAPSFVESIHCHFARMVMLWPIGWTATPPTGYKSKSLIEVSSEHTAINFENRQSWQKKHRRSLHQGGCAWNAQHD